jgi:hypothetical protein
LVVAGSAVIAVTLLVRLRRTGEETPRGVPVERKPTAGLQAQIGRIWELARWGLVFVIAGLVVLGFEYDRAVAVVLIAGAIGGGWRAFLAATGHVSEQADDARVEESALRRRWRQVEPFVDFLLAAAALALGVTLLLSPE